MKINLKSLGLKIVLNIALIAVMIYFLVQYSTTAGQYIETERADMEVRQIIVDGYGYIFRNEEIIYSPGGGSVNYLVDNGSKVGKHQVVARSHQTVADFSVKDRIAALEEKLDILHKSNINLEFVTASIDKIDGDSHLIYINMLQSIESGKIKDAGKNRNELIVLMNKKQLITGEVSGLSFLNLINSAEESKRRFEDQIAGSGIGAVEVAANKSGTFYSKVDGYENYLSADALKNFDSDKFDELIKKTPDADIINNALGKVAYDFNWYLVCKIKKNKYIDFVTDKKYNIVYPYSSNKSIASVLRHQIDGVDSGEVILIFETMETPSDFNFSRKQAIQIVCDEKKGIKVPEEAMRIVTQEDGAKAEGVYILKGTLVLFRELPKNECIDKFDGYYLYLEPAKRPADGTGGKLQLYEDIITAGKNLYDGKSIE